MSSLKRDREWDASASSGDSAAPVTDTDSKRPRISSPTSALSSDGVSFSHRPVLASEQSSQAHPMAILDGIRAKLQSTSDPHLQARLLLQYSSAAASPGAKTAAAIDFLFSFLQQNQTTQSDGNQTKDPGSSGAIVVGAIVRGLRQLLAVKSAVVEPMIQVDAMGEQLMQCMSVGEDFKLRRDMLRIVVDCLMLTKKYKQVETLLHTCVQDHDAGMQAICLRGYLRLHDAGRCFTAETAATQDTAVDHFDRLVGFVLFAQSEEVRVLAIQVIVALVDQHPRSEVENSKYFPSSADNKTPLFLPDKAFYVLCMAGNDASEAVRVEVARCLRRFSRVLASDIVEHAVVKTQIDEAVVDVAPEAVEMNTRRMMSSGVLLSLLEEIDVDVAAEASRTIAGLSEMSTTPDANTARWSQRALERAITAHFDVLPRASTSQLRQVLVSSLRRLLVCRHKLETKTDFAISSADLSSLLRSAVSDADSAKASVVEILLVLQHCDLSSTWAVQRLADFVLETAASTSFESYSVDSDDDNVDYWEKQFLDAVRDLGKKSSSVLKADVALTDRVRQETSQRSDQRHLVKSACQALLAHVDSSNGDNLDATSKSPSGSSLFFLKTSPSASCGTGSHTPSVSSQVTNSMNALRTPPTDGNIAVCLKAIQRLRTAFATDELDVSFRLADVLVRLRQHVHSFPDASAASAPTPLKYVSMSAMLSTSPSVSSGHTNSNSGGSQDHQETEAFASLQLPNDLQKGCQEMVDLASAIYVRAFALSSSPRAELLQLIMLGRVGLVLALLQHSADSLLVIEKLRWIAKEATRLRFLVNDSQRQDDVWLPTQLLSDVSSLHDLKRAFVASVRKAWPTALIEAAIARCPPATGNSDVHYRRLATAHASLFEPSTSVTAKPEPREITANWPFEQRVRFVLTNTRDITQVYVKSVLPNGDVAYHHVPASCIRTQGPRKHAVDHTITLTVSPFSDPTTFTVAVSLGHPTLPGSVKSSSAGSGDTSPRMFTEISSSVRVPISHRSSSTLRHAAARSSAA
ncbi:hypothetical protein PC129_g7108 [Phytophthora cactorum]|uniref:Integrator complex subunit 4/Protein SIEL C-terminal Ig-like domain-containing protein n=1 Tax=Phytophthora cactorum TaxID=29920 RepID=A0A329RZJ9_9STRA|nr:hypothetical protein Pcac1_g968 [Phytophthora cactorum]KAG2823310.1 hypothetical protein PC112_g10570 [Phytophthora cactorum]KAG2825456.1 hypothetical protein PC111_g9380 [Phytophthora cactorum]KAG2868832.1 hypothetical protein PC113_g671 [Phytophthora cactorum]KAG2905335.1 hypothetical protein PC114_g11592 [Phytophthora cactorum]